MTDPALPQLLALQETDRRLERIQNDLAACPAAMKALEQELAASRKAIEDEKQKIRQYQVRQKALDVELQGLADTVFKLKTQEAIAKKREQFAAIAHDMAEARRHIDDDENEGLELLEKIETGQQDLARHSVEQSDVEAGIKSRMADADARRQSLEQDLAALKTELATIRATIPAGVLSRYDAARKSKLKLPVVVPVENHVCMGCHLRLSNGALSQARAGLANCDQCGRLIFIPA